MSIMRFIIRYNTWGEVKVRLAAKLLIFLYMAFLYKAASATVAMHHSFEDWQKIAASSDAHVEKIEFFISEKDELTGRNLQPGTHKEISIAGVILKTHRGNEAFI